MPFSFSIQYPPIDLAQNNVGKCRKKGGTCKAGPIWLRLVQLPMNISLDEEETIEDGKHREA